MKQLGGNWFPDHEQHMIGWMAHPKNQVLDDKGRQTYQHRKQVAVLGYVKNWRTAVDAGAHVGLWSRNLANHFQEVHSFEPCAEHRECFVRNLADVVESGPAHVVLHDCALGAKPGRATIWTERGSSGNTQIKPTKPEAEGRDDVGTVEIRTLDSFDLQDVDFIKADCEGYELYVMQGARETILRCRPVICVEQKPHIIKNFGFKDPVACKFLEELGMVVRREYSGDYFLTFP